MTGHHLTLEAVTRWRVARSVCDLGHFPFLWPLCFLMTSSLHWPLPQARDFQSPKFSRPATLGVTPGHGNSPWPVASPVGEFLVGGAPPGKGQGRGFQGLHRAGQAPWEARLSRAAVPRPPPTPGEVS